MGFAPEYFEIPESLEEAHCSDDFQMWKSPSEYPCCVPSPQQLDVFSFSDTTALLIVLQIIKLLDRFTNLFILEKTSEIIECPLVNLTMALISMSSSFLNTSMVGDSTTSLGSSFQCLVTLYIKKFFLMSNVILPYTA